MEKKMERQMQKKWRKGEREVGAMWQRRTGTGAEGG
jgi:hypothetical protein